MLLILVHFRRGGITWNGYPVALLCTPADPLSLMNFDQHPSAIPANNARATKSGSFKPSKPDESKVVKSANNSPASSPALSRRVLGKKDPPPGPVKTNSTVPSSLDETITIDPCVDETLPLEKTTIIPKADNTITPCPCGVFDRKCIGIKCTPCGKEWHTECCNLSGVTPSVAKKLENQSWKCPWCYTPDVKNPEPLASGLNTSQTGVKLGSSAIKIEKCIEEFSGNVTTIEFFNEHIRHLLLDEDKFKQHSQKTDSIIDSVSSLKDAITQHTEALLFAKSLKNSIEIHNNQISSDIKALQSHVKALTEAPRCECHELVTTIDNQLASIQGENSDEGFRNEFLNKISSMQEDISLLSEAISSMKIQISTRESDISELSSIQQQLSEALSKPTCSDQATADNQTQDRIESIHNRLDDLSTQISSINFEPTINNPISTERTTLSTHSPNTRSPNSTEPPVITCDPFTSYKDSAISPEMKTSLNQFVENMRDSFTTIGTENSRDVLYFGEYDYRYSGGRHSAQEIPEEIQALITSIRCHLPNPKMKINSCLISRYNSGVNGIPSHRDDEAAIDPDSHIVTVSIGAERQMTFSNNQGNDIRHQTLKDDSVLVSSRFCQDFWLHSINPCESAEARYSFTLRHVDPHFINSTIILGDSNTANLKFGTGIGTLGAWMPGKRVKAGHIDEIPKAADIGPYRNIIIHTGINNINCSFQFKKSNDALISNLESKVREITETYPKAKVFISLLLPTRSFQLNQRIGDFNNLLLDMTYRLNRVGIIDHSLFGDFLCDDHGRWQRASESSDDFIPNYDDILHLGRIGIRILAQDLKWVVISKSKSQSTARYGGQ